MGRAGWRWEGKDGDGKGRMKMGRTGWRWEGQDEDGKGRMKMGRAGWKIGRWDGKNSG